MDDPRGDYCPGCKTSAYQNPKLKLLVNSCGHKLCDSCIKAMFVRPSAPCPQCGTILKRGEFRDHTFDDAVVEKEIDIRKKILKIYNKQEDDFRTVEDYDNYLEEIEDIIFNFVNGINVDTTKGKVEKYKKENQTSIIRNRSRLNLEQERITEKVKAELEEAQDRRKKVLLVRKEEDDRRRSNKEALLKDLTYTNMPAFTVLENYKKTQAEQLKESSFNKNTDERIVFIETADKGETYAYHSIKLYNFGPTPLSFDELTSKGYGTGSQVPEDCKGGGYTPQIACFRAIQEAYSGLFD